MGKNMSRTCDGINIGGGGKKSITQIGGERKQTSVDVGKSVNPSKDAEPCSRSQKALKTKGWAHSKTEKGCHRGKKGSSPGA